MGVQMFSNEISIRVRNFMHVRGTEDLGQMEQDWRRTGGALEEDWKTGGLEADRSWTGAGLEED